MIRKMICAMNETSTVQVLFVFPTPSTNVCSNIQASFPWSPPRLRSRVPPRSAATALLLAGLPGLYLTALAGLFRTVSGRGAVASGGPGLRLRRSV